MKVVSVYNGNLFRSSRRIVEIRNPEETLESGVSNLLDSYLKLQADPSRKDTSQNSAIKYLPSIVSLLIESRSYSLLLLSQFVVHLIDSLPPTIANYRKLVFLQDISSGDLLTRLLTIYITLIFHALHCILLFQSGEQTPHSAKAGRRTARVPASEKGTESQYYHH